MTENASSEHMFNAAALEMHCCHITISLAETVMLNPLAATPLAVIVNALCRTPCSMYA